MAYSRWGNSTWYTFWSAMGSIPTEYKLPTKKLKNNQVFEICDFPSYHITYGEIIEKGLAQTLKEIKEYYNQDHENIINEYSECGIPQPAKNPTEKEMVELGIYIEQFVKDVDDSFKWKEWIMFNWYYPLRNEIVWSWRDLVSKSKFDKKV
jgi:hypothetical protein